MGIPASPFSSSMAAPRAKSTHVDRGHAAADLATLCHHIGLFSVLKSFQVLERIEAVLIPNGIGCVFGNTDGTNPGGGMKRIASKASLLSYNGDDNGNGNGNGNGNDSIGTDTGKSLADSTVISDSKRGKQTTPEARHGCLLFLRALCEIVGTKCEPYVTPLLAAMLEESSSSSLEVREAAEDAATAIIRIVHPLATHTLIIPVLFEALQSPQWRVKCNALDRLHQLAMRSTSSPPNTNIPQIILRRELSNALPQILPHLTPQLWDTKPQVTKSAAAALTACCQTNTNPDIAPAIPAIISAMRKPTTDTQKAIDELKATTFVATVDASTLSILCPILSRGLKDRLALHKRSCCIVIENMSRLVETPQAVAPFGPLLVPELQRVAENVQFEEIRDAALAALGALTRALGHSSVDEALNAIMREEHERVEAERMRIEKEREDERIQEEASKRAEEEERKRFKEAMEAQRLLDKLALEEEEQKKAEEKRKKELGRKSVKGKTGKCQGCGLKKCKKTCLFYSQ